MIDDDDLKYRPWLQVGDFPPTQSASLHVQRVQFLRIKRGERPEKTSRYLGVSRSGKRWCAVITNKERRLEKVGLGNFATEELAARAYDIMSLASHGPDGITNFPIEDYKGLRAEWAKSVVERLAYGEPGEVEDARAALAGAAALAVSRAAKRGQGG